METQDLIYLISCAIDGVTPDADRVAAMDLEAVFELASRHMLAAVAAPALEASGVRDQSFQNAFRCSVLKNAVMDAETDALFRKLNGAGIWHLPLKGIVLQHLYPQYGMRQMSDHDILFDDSRTDDVKAIMEELGFCNKPAGPNSASHHDVYFKQPVSHFEMHRRLFHEGESKMLIAYYEDVRRLLRGDGYEKHLDPEDFYLYQIAHEYAHYCSNGTGLRSLLDTYVYLRKQPLDMAYVAAEAEKMGIGAFEAANRALSMHLFSGEALTEAEREMLDRIVASGVYGSSEQRMANRLTRRGQGKLRYALSRFFVPISRRNREYDDFARVYPFFYEHKVLLPLLPFYRILLGLKNGRLNAEVKTLKNAKL